MNFIKFVRKTDNVLISWYEKIAALSLKQTTCRLHALWSMAVFCTNRWKINLPILIKQFRQQGCINFMFQLSAEETSLHSNTPRSKTAFCLKKSDHVVTWWTSFFSIWLWQNGHLCLYTHIIFFLNCDRIITIYMYVH